MTYLLDTNVCIDAMRRRFGVDQKLISISPEDCAISAITAFELEVGALKSQNPVGEMQKVQALAEAVAVLPWECDAATRAAEVRFALEKSGMKIGAYDTLLAGHALAAGAILVTSNVGEFKRVENLEVENWRTT
jgi:tRNA(fMet)-specific endonuclease VapC